MKAKEYLSNLLNESGMGIANVNAPLFVSNMVNQELDKLMENEETELKALANLYKYRSLIQEIANRIEEIAREKEQEGDDEKAFVLKKSADQLSRAAALAPIQD